jgi:hypothetical protein
MSDPEGFLTRWSRRKHAANVAAEENAPSIASSAAASRKETEPCEPEPPGETHKGTASQTPSPRLRGENPGGGAPAHAQTPKLADPPFDPLGLPSIEAIGADTDIRGFLAPGVPPELTRAALRRAWAADPKIRDFVGPADYDWDFNAPGTMAGFGSLEMTDELRRVMAQIAGQISDRERPNSTADQDSGNADPAGIAAPMTPAASEDDQTEPTQKSSTAAPAPPDKNLMPAKKPI